jgi:CheY-like chemotaxis protein
MPAETPRRKTMLFVDDDADFLTGVKEIFSGMSSGTWDIATAENHSQALAELARQAKDVVVLDFNMPVMDGLQFLRLLRRTHPGQQVVMLTSRTDDATRTTCLDNGAALFLHKLLTPEGFEGVFSALDALAGAVPQTGFRGMMRRVDLQEVLQMECLGRKSSVLEIFAGKSRGRIFIHDGAIIHAESGALQGEVALYSLLALRGGEFNLQAFTPPPRATISGQYEFLLMEAARLSDEGTQFIQAGAAQESSAVLSSEGDAGPSEAPAPPSPAEPIVIHEVLLCSGAGEVLYEKGCSSVEQRSGLLAQIEQQAEQLSNLVPAGRFDRLEILTLGGQIICQIQPHLRLFVRGGSDGLACP